MNDQELCLAKVEELRKQFWLTGWLSAKGDKEMDSLLRALRAVVEMHKPVELEQLSTMCSCSRAFNVNDRVLFPCPTITAIAKELGVGE